MRLEHVLSASVHTREPQRVQEARVPLERIGVERFAIVGATLCPPTKGLVKGVEEGEWSPIERAADVVDASKGDMSGRKGKVV